MVKESKKTTRRTFLNKLWIGLGIATALELTGGAVYFLLNGRKKEPKSSEHILDVGLVTDFKPGSVSLISRGHCYLVRLEDGGFLAVSRKCTHLGCAVPWVAERKQFECPCHASVFDQRGNVLKSPAPRALDRFPVVIDRGRVHIKQARPIRRSEFSKDQLVFAPEHSRS